MSNLIHSERLVQLFKDLVSINAPAKAEADVVRFTRKYLEDIGLEVWEDNAGEAIGGNANNLIAKLPGNVPGAPRIYLSAHFDTVEPTAGLVIGERNGVLYSESDTILGADDKGGMAPAIEAVRSIMENCDPHGDVYLLFSVAEEIGLLGAAAMKIEDLDVDFGYVLDTGPPVGSYVTRAATHDKLDVTIKGKPAHAGKDPELGINAIQVAADALSRMTIGRIGPETTANFGIIHGGTAVNVVCPEVTLRGEARSTDVEALDQQIAHMVKTLEEAAAKYGAELIIDHKRHYSGYIVPEDSEVVRVAVAASRTLGLAPTLRTTLGGSDANVFNAKGVPSIVVATGMEKIHTHDEEIRIESLLQTAQLAREIILQAAQSRIPLAQSSVQTSYTA